MLHTNQAPSIKIRANHLVDQVFSTQLEILQSVLPLRGWLLGYDYGDHLGVMASIGEFTGVSQAVCASMMLRGSWLPQKECAVACCSMENALDELQGLVSTARFPDQTGNGLGKHHLHVVRMALNTSDKANQAYLFGLSDICPCSTLNSVQNQVSQCLEAIGLIVALHTELSALNQRATQIQRDAFIDTLTLVMNRAGWNHALLQLDTEKPSTAAGAAIIMLDLDLLKEVNDSQGHSAGDDLLCLTARTITSVLRSEDLVARLGGDEFGILVKNATPNSANLLMRRLKDAFDAAKIGISMGSAMQSEVDNSLQATVEMADKRMYADKRAKPVTGKHYLDWMLGRVGNSA
ncbi:GGDEF domain-containing protein [Alcaligenaceae bacterium]|nr:GGDEF domain-containing protein [Alcaligenaceae bacterium]